MAIIFPEGYEIRSGDGEPFDREPSGLVDLDFYRPYLVDEAQDVPTVLQKETINGSRFRFVYQHLFFRENLYHQTFLDKDDRDRRYRALRELTYGQIVMRSYKEQQLHNETEGDVAYPPEETVDNTLRDYFDLDMIGGSVLGIEEIRNPRPPDEWRARQPVDSMLAKLTDEERMGAFEAKLQELLTSTETPRVLPDKIVASALMRLATHLQDPILLKAAEERLPADGYYFPLRVPKLGTLRTIATAVLKSEVGIKDLEISRIQHQTLQVEDEKLERAA
jgi:hypothetical protein